MATETTVIDIKIETANSANTIKDLRKSLKGLVDELGNVPAGSKEFNKLSKAINDTEGKIGDLTYSFQTLKGSGIERTNASMGLLREGFKNFDTDKIKAGLNGVGAAFKAIPIFLVVQGIQYLVENFDKLKGSGGLLGKALTAISDVMEELGNFAEWLGDKIGIVDLEMNKLSDTVDEYGKKSEELLKKQNAQWDQSIKLAAASGKSTVDAEIAKQEAIKKTNIQLALNLKYLEASGRELTDKQKELLEGYIEAAKNASNEIKVLQAKDEKDRQDKAKERIDKQKQEQKDLDKALSEAKIEGAEIDKEIMAMIAKDINDEKLAQLAIDKAILDEKLAAEQKAYDESVKLNDEANENKKKSDAAVEDAKSRGLQAAQALSEAFFAFQLRAAQGNEKKELEIRKRMFQVDKAFNVARAVQDGIRSVQAALTIPPPGGQILAAINGFTAAANVAKILATKFDPGSGGGGGAGDISAPTSSTPNIPTNTTQAPTTQASTTFDSQGRNQNFVVTAKVYEGEMTSTQKRAAKIDSMSTI